MRVAGHREWPAEYFGRVARGLEERAGRYKATIAVSCHSLGEVNDEEADVDSN